jgi:hypothetical protein
MILLRTCRRPLPGHPRYGWWSLDPGMDRYYLRTFGFKMDHLLSGL